MGALEKEQRRFTGALPGLEGGSYEEKLRDLGKKAAKREFDRDIKDD